MPDARDRERRVRLRLRGLLAERGISLAAVERAHGWGAGYLSQALSGKIDLKMQHVFEILEVAEEPADSFFGELFDAELGRALRALLKSAATLNGGGAEPIDDDHVSGMIRAIADAGDQIRQQQKLGGDGENNDVESG